jgi:FkbM family methyltransferase
MYSQNNEEALILEAVGSIVGRFLDIGANDGAYLSNTLALVERGWSGVLVEANPATFARLAERHGANPKLALVNAAVGLEWGLTHFWAASKDSGLSTTEEAQRECRAADAGYGGVFYVPMIPLAELLAQFSGPIDVLSIDTEGTSMDLFLAFPIWRYHPKVLVIEHDGKADLCRDLGAHWGYRIAGQNAENVVLVR